MRQLIVNPKKFDGLNPPSQVYTDEVVVVNPSGNWHLYNRGYLEITKDSYHQYLELWSSHLEDIGSKVLIIGGGDFQIASMLDTEIDLVDPHVEDYVDFHNCLKTPKVNKIAKKYSEVTLGSYDTVLIDISDPNMDITKEIYCEDFIKGLPKASKYVMYLPEPVHTEMLGYIEKYYEVIAQTEGFIQDWGEMCYVVSFVQ